MTLSEGELLDGRYRIESLVRARAAGRQFEATDLSTGARVSVHALAPCASSVEDQYERACLAFLAGARCAKVLRGPHVARVLDAGVTEEGDPWIVRAHLGSDTLAGHLPKHGAIALRDAADITLAICDAIAEAHSNGLLHGSLGPHAVHVAWSASGLADVKVTGAGTAAAEHALSLGPLLEVECVLRAPECLVHGAPIDARADVWSIAVLFHTMVAGRAPFATDTPSGASLSVVLDDPPRLDNVPAELAAAVLQALAKNPSRRPRNVLLFARTLVDYASNREAALARIEARRAALENALPREGESGLFADFTLETDERRAVNDELTSAERAAGGLYLTSDARPAASRKPKASDSIEVEVTFDEPAPPASRNAPTRIVPRARPLAVASQRGRRVVEFVALMAVAASVVLGVLVGTERWRASLRSKMNNSISMTIRR